MIKKWFAQREKILQKRSNFSLFLTYFLPAVVIWSSCLIAAWSKIPFNGDISWQWEQIYGLVPFDNTHPVAHTLYMWLFKYIGGLATYHAAQIVLFSATYALALMFFERRGVSRTLLEILAQLFAISLLNISFALIGTKDLPYTIAVFGIVIVCMSAFEKNGKNAPIWLGALLAACTLLRHNGVLVAVGIMVLFPVLYFKEIRRILSITLLAVSLFVGVRFIAFNLMGATPGSWNYFVTSIYSKPIMGIIANDGNISAEQLEFIDENICPINAIKEKYNPYTFDDFLMGTETSVNSMGIDFWGNVAKYEAEITEMFWELFPKNRKLVINDWFKTRHFIYSFWWSNADSRYQVLDLPFVIIKHGQYLLATLVVLIIAAKRKGFKAILPFAPVLLNVLSVFSSATPEYRYLWSTFICFPFLLIFTFHGGKNEQN